MRRALVAALLLGALASCSLRPARTDAAPACSGNPECDPGNVCFLGECRPPAAALSQVLVEIRPPNDSRLGGLQRAQVDLHQSAVVDFQLQPQLDVSGTASEAGDGGAGLQALDGGTPGGPSLPGATLTFTDHAPAIPDRVRKVTTYTDATGAFSARLPSADWDLVVQPLPARGLPLFSLPEAVNGVGRILALRAPSQGLSVIDGALAAGGLALGGASVTAVDLQGEPLASQSTNLDGGFELTLPPGPPPFRLQVSAGEADGGMGNPAVGDPLPNFLPFGPAAATPFVDAQPIHKDFGPLPPRAVLHGTVTAAGAAVAGARVSALSTDGNGWTISRTTTAAADGSFSLQLRAGAYLVEAAPDTAANQPAVSGERPLVLGAGDNFAAITCLPKTRALGLVTLPGSEGRPAGEGYQVTATRLPDRVISGRTAFTTATDSAGIFHLVGDAGRYRLEIVPPHAAGLPRKTVQIELGDGGGPEVALPAIQLSRPLNVYGTVTGQSTAGGPAGPVASATVDFFALDAAGRSSIYLGTGVTDLNGHYAAVLPDVPQPGLLP